MSVRSKKESKLMRGERRLYLRPRPSSKKAYSNGMFVNLRCGLCTCRIRGRSHTTTSLKDWWKAIEKVGWG